MVDEEAVLGGSGLFFRRGVGGSMWGGGGEEGPFPCIFLGCFLFELYGDGMLWGEPFEDFAVKGHFCGDGGPCGFVEADDDFGARGCDEWGGDAVEVLVGAPEGKTVFACFAGDDADDAIAFFVVGGCVGAELVEDDDIVDMGGIGGDAGLYGEGELVLEGEEDEHFLFGVG